MTDEAPKAKRGRPPKKQTVTMRVERDYWPTEEDLDAGWPKTERNRVRAGTLIEVSTEAAMDGLEAGMLSRVK